MRSNARTGAFGSFAETFDFGFVEPLAIGDKLFIDLNGDGAQNDGGGGVSGVTVTARITRQNFRSYLAP